MVGVSSWLCLTKPSFIIEINWALQRYNTEPVTKQQSLPVWVSIEHVYFLRFFFYVTSFNTLCFNWCFDTSKPQMSTSIRFNWCWHLFLFVKSIDLRSYYLAKFLLVKVLKYSWYAHWPIIIRQRFK